MRLHKLTNHDAIQAFSESFTGPGQELSELRYHFGPCYAYAVGAVDVVFDRDETTCMFEGSFLCDAI